MSHFLKFIFCPYNESQWALINVV